jgi:hypothetical protein
MGLSLLEEQRNDINVQPGALRDLDPIGWR